MRHGGSFVCLIVGVVVYSEYSVVGSNAFGAAMRCDFQKHRIVFCDSVYDEREYYSVCRGFAVSKVLNQKVPSFLSLLLIFTVMNSSTVLTLGRKNDASPAVSGSDGIRFSHPSRFLLRRIL